MIFLFLYCFPTLTSKCPKGRFVALWFIYDPRHEKICFCISKNKDAAQVTAQLISAFVFSTKTLQTLYFLNPKFQASSHVRLLYSSVCVGPGLKPRRQVLSRLCSYLVVNPPPRITIQPELMGRLGSWADV